MAPPLRRGTGHHRPRDDARQQAVHDRRRPAAALSASGCRRRAAADGPMGGDAARRSRLASRNLSAGPIEGGHHAPAGAGRDGSDLGSAGETVSGVRPGRVGRGEAAARLRRAERQAVAGAARRRGGIRAADRVRERREPAARARGRPSEGDRHPHRDRRQPRADRAAAHRRKVSFSHSPAAPPDCCWPSGPSRCWPCSPEPTRRPRRQSPSMRRR